VRLLLACAAWLTVLGSLAGLVLALLASRAVTGMLFGVTAADRRTASGAIMLAAAMASHLPARRILKQAPGGCCATSDRMSQDFGDATLVEELPDQPPVAGRTTEPAACADRAGPERLMRVLPHGSRSVALAATAPVDSDRIVRQLDPHGRAPGRGWAARAVPG
jgi:hypothetical protein